WDNVTVCMAKTQYSLSDDPALLGKPSGFKVTVRELIAKNGAGFVLALTGDIMTMPGLPKVPSAVHMDVDADGNSKGLFYNRQQKRLAGNFPANLFLFLVIVVIVIVVIVIVVVIIITG